MEPRPRTQLAEAAARSSRSIAGISASRRKELLGGAADDVRSRSRPVAAVGLRQQPVRRGRPRGAPARDEAGGGGAGDGVRVGVLVGAAGDPGAGPGEGAQVRRRRSRSSLPTACTWRRRCAASRTRWAPPRSASPPKRASSSAPAARCTACSPTPTCRTRPSSCRRASRCASTPPAFSLHRQARSRADRDKVFAAFFGALKTYERTMGATLGGGREGAPVREARAPLRFDARGGAVPGQHPDGRLQAAARRRAPQPADAAPLPGAAQTHAGPGRPALPGPLRAARRERRHALRAGRGAGHHARRAGAARARTTPRRCARASRAAGPTTCRRRASGRARIRPASTACTRISC